MDKISQALENLFQKHRIVFWYDAERELRQEFEQAELEGVQKIELHNNEYGVKHRILRAQPKDKFLLYQAGPEPEPLDNWLLDVLLANGRFSADQLSLWLAEIGLGPQFRELLQEHAEFFQAAGRRAALKARLAPNDSHQAVRLKMLAVAAGSTTDARLESSLEALLSELAQGQEEKLRLVQRCKLEAFFWQSLRTQFGYISDAPSLRDFTLALFAACYALGLGEEAKLNQDALVFLKRWKDSLSRHRDFETLSDQSATDLSIGDDLEGRGLEELAEIDFFSLVDQRILSELAGRVAARTISAGEVENLIWRRRATHWFERYADPYEAILHAARFIAGLGEADLHIRSLSDGVRKYASTWFRLDQHYRKFIYHARASGQTTLLRDLTERTENLYSNNYLLPLNDHLQAEVDALGLWDASPVPAQRAFFSSQVHPAIQGGNKLAVVISDALRYEIGEELVVRIEREDRYSASISPMLSVLPSYTQLGMAALLPHAELSIRPDGVVLADGSSTAGRENRGKILSEAVPGGARAMSSEALLALGREEARALFRDHALVYVYQDQIDAAGDSLKTEERVFEAAERTIAELLEILKKLTSANYTNLLITADHGFIYQHRPLDESEFAGLEVEGEEIYLKNRRFVLGRGLRANPSVRVFRASELGLAGEVEAAIPKSINRLRVQGSGSRYVHGGAALQEIVVPLIAVNKKRSSDIETVEVDIITSSSAIITSGQLSVAFYQTEPVSAKLQPRRLRVGIYAQDGSLISNPEELNFDFSAENPREREVKLRFVLSRKADEVNHQTVYLKMEEPVPGTTHFKLYKTMAYQLRRSFRSDFDL